MELKLTFDDVGLSPLHNNVESRNQPILNTWLTNDLQLSLPLLAANMDTVIGDELADILGSHGSVPIFHRFTDYDQKVKWIKNYSRCFISCGVTPEALKELYQLHNGPDPMYGVCFDVAQGHDARLYKAIETAKDYDLEVIAGNVCTAQGYIDLVNAGADAVKVGIGPGAACTTRLVTGFGVPQMSALLDIRQAALRYKIPYIADGGIRSSGDAVKALAAGASAVMIGRGFAQCEESAGQKRGGTDLSELPRQVNYRGQASDPFQREGMVAEGVNMWLPVLSSATEFINDFCAGIRSGLTYGGSKNIPEFQKKAIDQSMIFRVTSSSQLESGTRS